MAKQKSKDDVLKYIKQVSEKRNWNIHPNSDGTLDLLVDGLTTNFNRIGYFNCPCRDSEEDIKIDRDIVCPCDYAQPDIEEFGRCYCALFFDPEYDFSKSIEMIPERRPMPEW